LLLSCLLPFLWNCTKYCPTSCNIGHMRDRTDDWSTLWSCDHSSSFRATILVRIHCPQSFHGHTEHSLCHLTDRICPATVVSQVCGTLINKTYFLSANVETFRRAWLALSAWSAACERTCRTDPVRLVDMLVESSGKKVFVGADIGEAVGSSARVAC
jgi:hypothetical protein